jgi:hypothetical protein
MKTPWGRAWKLVKTSRFWCKLFWVRDRTSLQSHNNRTEYHFGFYKVKPGEKHRLQHGVFLEVAVGRPDEDDVTRYEDDFGRN